MSGKYSTGITYKSQKLNDIVSGNWYTDSKYRKGQEVMKNICGNNITFKAGSSSTSTNLNSSSHRGSSEFQASWNKERNGIMFETLC